nr:hypothetical protein [Candidatus Sigynarchaeota archaeon]
MVDVKITLKPETIVGPLQKLMADFGFDEIRAVLDPLGQKVFDLILEANNHSVLRNPSTAKLPKLERSRDFEEFPNKVFRYVRCHNMFTGDGGDRQGAKNAGLVQVTFDEKGLHCNFDRLDAAYQTFIDAGCIPFVEFGFTPPALAMNSRMAHAFKQPDARDALVNFDPRTDFDDDPLAIQACPPRSYTVWVDLVQKTVKHLQERFGATKIKDWLFELWNEPDLYPFWAGTIEEYAELFEKTVKAIKAIDPELRIGAPAIAGRNDALKRFLSNVVQYKVPLDFISVHVKGGSPGAFAHPDSDHIMDLIREYVKTIGEFKEFSDLASPMRVPILLDEADEFLNCVSGILENPIYAFRETTYYPCFVVNLYRKLIMYLRNDAPPWVTIHGAYSDNLHMVDERLPFGGYRCTTTAVPVDRSNANSPKVVSPFVLASGRFDVAPNSTRWNVHAHIIDRQRLFSVHPAHPAWTEPFIVVKKPVFHIYPLLQALGPVEIGGEVTIDPGVDHGSWISMIPSLSHETKEIAVLAWYFTEDLNAAGSPLLVEVTVPPWFNIDEKQAVFKGASHCEVSPETCNAFDEWKKNWADKDALDAKGIDALLKYNKNTFEPEPVEKKDQITFRRTLTLGSLHEWILKYE